MDTSRSTLLEEFRITRNTNILRGKNAEVLIVKRNGIYSYHYVLMGNRGEKIAMIIVAILLPRSLI